MSHALIASIEEYGLLSVLVLIAAVVSLVIRFLHGLALAAHCGDG